LQTQQKKIQAKKKKKKKKPQIDDHQTKTQTPVGPKYKIINKKK
jgi:hypothetical protein